MPYNPHASYWAQFSSRAEDSYLERPRPRAVERLVEAHDAPTTRMIEQWSELYRLAGADTIVPLIERWQWLERMGSAEQKQQLLESLIQSVQREPERRQPEAIFVLLTLEPIRRSIASKLLAGVRLGNRAESPTDRHRREEARWIGDLEREELLDHTRMATLELVYRYGFDVAPGRFFGWFRETLAWRVTDVFREKYLVDDDRLSPTEREAVQAFLHGFDDLEGPSLRDGGAFTWWRMQLGGLANTYHHVNAYGDSPRVRRACRAAIGRLAPVQQETIDAYFFDNLSLKEIAQRRGVAVSTVGNTKAKAESRLRGDDIFYCALDGLGRTRDLARRREIERRYPNGRLPDGKRIVWIGAEAA